MRLDFDAIRERVSVESLLSRYGVETRKSGKGELRGRCPLPTHSSKESGASFYANPVTKLLCCQSDSCAKASGRKGYNVLQFVAAMERTDIRQAAMKLDEWYPAGGNGGNGDRDGGNNDRTSNPPIGNLTPVQNPAKAGSLVASLSNKPLGYQLQNVNPCHPMIQSRGITVETARDWGVGFYRSKQRTASMDDRIVFPLSEDGVVVGYAGRTVLEVTPQNPKWKLGKGLVKSFLYGLERCDPAKPLVVVEGCWPVLKFHQQGIQTAALLGSEMTEAQERRLEPYRTVWVMMDDDDKGRAATDKIAARLRAKGHSALKARLKE